MVTITDKAKERILQIMQNEQYDNTYFVRVAVESGGCSGLSYRLQFDNEEKKGYQLSKENVNNIFHYINSYLYLGVTELDYTDGLYGICFEFHNPNTSPTCACGDIFSV